MIEKKEWFSEWFESPFYDLLYTNRNEEEAAFFLDNLLKCTQLKQGAKILDLPCGKGRHAIYLHQKGFDVLGADLSERSISFAKQFETKGLRFRVHDMRDPIPESAFDLALNLFTSFGYFEAHEDNLKVLTSISESLKPESIFVLDYLNGEMTRRHLVAREEKQEEGISFHIQRTIKEDFVIKHIRVEKNDTAEFFHYQEKVRLFSLPEFEELFAKAHLTLRQVAGNYALEPYNPGHSERLILIASKQTH